MSGPPPPLEAAPHELRLLRARRRFVAFSTTTVLVGLGLFMLRLLGKDGLDLLDAAAAMLFVLAMPWIVVGAINASIGLLIGLWSRDPAAFVCPAVGRAQSEPTERPRTAILLPIHEEESAVVFRHIGALLRSLDETGSSAEFELFVLSDTQDAAAAAEEERHFAALRATAARPQAVHYRRRRENSAHKTGNLWDFLDRQGANFRYGLVLDADSLMDAGAVNRLVRIMEASPEIGILQQLTVSLPSRSPFSRLFQAGMRPGMRVHALGAAWWQGDCGPYWGHNALIRLAPFIAYCRIDPLPGRPPFGGRVLSHDQVEAVLMRRAGWQVRLLADSAGSYELDPPTLVDFFRRDLRWCQGNFQYLRLLKGLRCHALGKVQLASAILMYLTGPALGLMAIAMLGRSVLESTGLFAPSLPLEDPWLGRPAAFEPWLLAGIVLVLTFAPKLAGTLESLVRGSLAEAQGGRARVVTVALAELMFSLVLTPLMLMAQARFTVGMVLGRRARWRGQPRAVRRLGWAEAWGTLRFEFLAALLLLPVIAWLAPDLLAFALPLGAIAILGPSFAMITANPALGRQMSIWGLCASPEELNPPPILRAAGYADVDYDPVAGTSPVPATGT